MTSPIDDITEGLIETIEDVSHDPDMLDYADVREYIENLPNPYHTLWEFARWVHEELL